MSKVIIIEGPDNCGKDILVERLKTCFNNVKVCHAGIPSSSNLFIYYLDGFIHDTLDGYYDKNTDAVIHNRSMYGEYVYGPKYRNESREEVEKVIDRLETGQLRTFIFEHELFFVLLTSSSTKLLAGNDDGLSISNKESDIADEINSFSEIFDKSKIKNKLKVYVNDGDVFRNKDDIFLDVASFILSRSSV